MKANNYKCWQETAHVLHMITQMMGKVKLTKIPPQPEWQHTLLPLTTDGFTTGLIPNGEWSFEIQLDIRKGEVQAKCSSGRIAGMPLYDGGSISGYYAAFLEMIAYIGHETAFSPIPQEVPDVTPFPEQTRPLPYDAQKAQEYFENCVFVRNALLQFSAPFRGKKIVPQLFWGTFDLTTVLFSGEEKPFSGNGLIEQVAFDEQLIEFGFWPGDQNVAEPQLFVLAYPFVKDDLRSKSLHTDGAYYSIEKNEFFLPLSKVMQSSKPLDTVLQFCMETFAILTQNEGWPRMDWFTKPLLCKNEISKHFPGHR